MTDRKPTPKKTINASITKRAKGYQALSSELLALCSSTYAASDKLTNIASDIIACVGKALPPERALDHHEKLTSGAAHEIINFSSAVRFNCWMFNRYEPGKITELAEIAKMASGETRLVDSLIPGRPADFTVRQMVESWEKDWETWNNSRPDGAPDKEKIAEMIKTYRSTYSTLLECSESISNHLASFDRLSAPKIESGKPR